ncbi:MAG: hypothetical protein EOP31_19855 [Rhodococcus sp. (in: high G+C Gram-positive bacteria)]|nr:MAG: hypothetical protein EOP31_19855 [Rhodococcus sp. (in: high G+C Gram-positive bacteria)]
MIPSRESAGFAGRSRRLRLGVDIPKLYTNMFVTNMFVTNMFVSMPAERPTWDITPASRQPGQLSTL